MDKIFVNAEIVDGTGAPSYSGDVGVAGGRIAFVRRHTEQSHDDDDCADNNSVSTIDVQGHVLSPGFIDLHSHSDFSIMGSPSAETQLAQGVTTAVVGNCGSSPFPARSVAEIERNHAHLGAKFTGDWSDATEFAELVDDVGPGINIALQIGLSTLRNFVMGPVDAGPDRDQLRAMAKEIHKAAEAGVYGFSSGLIYAPGSYAKFGEVRDLVTEAARHDLLYSTHMRDEAGQLLRAVNEAIEVARSAGARLEISHLKAMGPENFGKTREALSLIERARAEAIDVKADVYPYSASSTTLTAQLPGYALDGGKDALVNRLLDRFERQRIAADFAARFGKDVNPEGVRIAALGKSVGDDDYAWALGLSLTQISEREGCTPQEAAMRVLSVHNASVGIINHAMSPADVAEVVSHPLVSIASDGWILQRGGQGMPHPRSFGTFAHVLGKYVREDSVLSLEEAVRKMTSQPAERLGMVERGTIQEGQIADIVVFDPSVVRQNSSYTDPWHLATGIETVLVGGKTALENGEVSSHRYGRVLRKR